MKLGLTAPPLLTFKWCGLQISTHPHPVAITRNAFVATEWLMRISTGFLRSCPATCFAWWKLARSCDGTSRRTHVSLNWTLELDGSCESAESRRGPLFTMVKVLIGSCVFSLNLFIFTLLPSLKITTTIEPCNCDWHFPMGHLAKALQIPPVCFYRSKQGVICLCRHRRWMRTLSFIAKSDMACQHFYPPSVLNTYTCKLPTKDSTLSFWDTSHPLAPSKKNLSSLYS
jgi:hypothetical protein